MRRFLALSRSMHGLLDLAMPGFVALLWLGDFPPWRVLALCLLTGAAGYTAIYALNDLAGFKDDRQKMADGLSAGYSVEASALRYPLARNLISMKAALAWFGFWFALTLVGAWLLHPLIVAILLGAAVLEVAYCKLLKVTAWRTLLGGLVKAAGPLAAVFVVVPEPDWRWLPLMLVWLVLWEIGGQNVPADWNDLQEDRAVGARTLPLVLGTQAAGRVIVLCLCGCVALSLLLPLMSPLALGWAFPLACLLAGGLLLLWPAVRLARSRDGALAAQLFDCASLYPLALLIIVTVFVVGNPG